MKKSFIILFLFIYSNYCLSQVVTTISIHKDYKIPNKILVEYHGDPHYQWYYKSLTKKLKRDLKKVNIESGYNYLLEAIINGKNKKYIKQRNKITEFDSKLIIKPTYNFIENDFRYYEFYITLIDFSTKKEVKTFSLTYKKKEPTYYTETKLISKKIVNQITHSK